MQNWFLHRSNMINYFLTNQKYQQNYIFAFKNIIQFIIKHP